jgi:hypothetical protein
MRRALVILATVLSGCWAGHDSCGIAPPGEWAGEATEPTRDAAPSPPWTAGRIEDALRIDPMPALKTLSHGHPLLVADADAGTFTPVCGEAALDALNAFADELGPRNEPPICSEAAAHHGSRAMICIRPHDGQSSVALAFTRRGEEWDLTALMKGTRPDVNFDSQLFQSPPVCL